jgi:hypothetical protein
MEKRLLLFFFLMLFIMAAYGQENVKKESKEEALKGANRLSLVLGHAHLSQGIKDDGTKGWKAVPSIAFDYDYWISNHWAIGLHNDLMVEDIEVEDHDNTVIERSKPFASVATAIFKPKRHVSFMAGMGAEFAAEGNLALTRLGIETGWEMKNNWEFGIGLVYDIKWNAYDTWVFGFGISKILRKHRG